MFRLIHLLNTCWMICIILNEWKVVKVISVVETGDRTVPPNYIGRPVWLINTTYNLYEKLLLENFLYLRYITDKLAGFCLVIYKVFSLKILIETAETAGPTGVAAASLTDVPASGSKATRRLGVWPATRSARQDE